MDVNIIPSLHKAVRHAETLHSLFGGDRPAAAPAEALDHPEAALEHVMRLLAFYAGVAGRSSASQLLSAVTHLLSVSGLQATVSHNWAACAML